MWPDGAVDVPFDGAQGDTSTPPSARRRRVGWLAVALMVLGVVLVGLAVVRGSVAPAVAGVLVGAAGAVLAWRAGIMEDVSVSDSPHG